MFKEHNYIIWGTKCPCGRENFILQNKFHPWNESDFKIVIKCSYCKSFLTVDKQAAEQFYNERIYSYFEDVEGIVLDVGYGGGFLTQHLINKESVEKIYAIDIDENSKEEINKLVTKHKNIEFKLCDLKNILEAFKEKSVDYVVNRDVFMFVEDTQKYFDDITKIVRKGIRQMGWFISDNKRMKNKLMPSDIAAELKKRGWKVELRILEMKQSARRVTLCLQDVLAGKF
ncbi:class I SAM-dependent methyltransferase [Clostridium sp. D2Q-14]|uniref:class I SAM-dependent methyltransferase n=1 Tax=Anaeromonas gelatinilytica TaxID=2683194 RepID=UPI00193BD908|nr:class I SAM-dependent methyltransferase [Anaeromonas gelatinilytica]MBS4535341.1 class I SAM-dependent methyltransferase [Anaeromonas gelatinilytica]